MLISFGASQGGGLHQLYVTWSTSGGCPWYDGTISWTSQGLLNGGGGIHIATPSGAITAQLAGPLCPSPAQQVYALVDVNMILGDVVGQHIPIQQTYVRIEMC